MSKNFVALARARLAEILIFAFSVILFITLSIPWVAKTQFVKDWGPIFQHLSVAAIVTIIVHLYATLHLLKDIDAHIEAAVDHGVQISSAVTKEIRALHKDRDTAGVNQELAKGRKNIDVLVTSLNSFTVKRPGTASLFEALLEKHFNNPEIKIRILTLDPRNDFMKTRYLDVGHSSEEGFAIEMLDSLAKVVDTLNHAVESQKLTFLGSLEVRLYNRPPALTFYRIDNRAFLGFTLTSAKPSRSSDHPFLELRISPEDKLNNVCFQNHFDELWCATTKELIKNSTLESADAKHRRETLKDSPDLLTIEFAALPSYSRHETERILTMLRSSKRPTASG